MTWHMPQLWNFETGRFVLGVLLVTGLFACTGSSGPPPTTTTTVVLHNLTGWPIDIFIVPSAPSGATSVEVEGDLSGTTQTGDTNPSVDVQNASSATRKIIAKGSNGTSPFDVTLQLTGKTGSPAAAATGSVLIQPSEGTTANFYISWDLTQRKYVASTTPPAPPSPVTTTTTLRLINATTGYNLDIDIQPTAPTMPAPTGVVVQDAGVTTGANPITALANMASATRQIVANYPAGTTLPMRNLSVKLNLTAKDAMMMAPNMTGDVTVSVPEGGSGEFYISFDMAQNKFVASTTPPPPPPPVTTTTTLTLTGAAPGFTLDANIQPTAPTMPAPTGVVVQNMGVTTGANPILALANTASATRQIVATYPAGTTVPTRSLSVSLNLTAKETMMLIPNITGNVAVLVPEGGSGAFTISINFMTMPPSFVATPAVVGP